jgi:hypothetical protein
VAFCELKLWRAFDAAMFRVLLRISKNICHMAKSFRSFFCGGMTRGLKAWDVGRMKCPFDALPKL